MLSLVFTLTAGVSRSRHRVISDPLYGETPSFFIMLFVILKGSHLHCPYLK